MTSLALSLIALSLVVGCVRNSTQRPASTREQPVFGVPEYSAETTVENYIIHVDLFHSHPFLAEYRKVVRVTHAGKLIVTKEYRDTGGLASFYLLRNGNRIIVVDGILQGFVLNPATGSISNVDPDSVPDEFTTRSFGRFMFVDDPDRAYKWIPSKDLPKWVTQ
jgi:hypothetical protein